MRETVQGHSRPGPAQGGLSSWYQDAHRQGYYEARQEWVASQSLSGSEAETTPGEPDERASAPMRPFLEQMIDNMTEAGEAYDDLVSALARRDRKAISAGIQTLKKCCVKVVET